MKEYVDIQGADQGLNEGNSSPLVRNSDIAATGGSNHNVGYASHLGASLIYNSRIQGDTLSVEERSTNDGQVQIAHSQLDGERVSLNLICVYSYDENYDEVDGMCSPTLP
ncbi:MAG TPA: hypothetical protein VK879_19905 [Candidatus Sulfomarinibacteraceae bacterium]|nr:hypothetical protein [Candidatus Sulfomarinibacteraceae bacterium]